MAVGLGLSVLLHALVLSLQFGIPASKGGGNGPLTVTLAPLPARLPAPVLPVPLAESPAPATPPVPLVPEAVVPAPAIPAPVTPAAAPPVPPPVVARVAPPPATPPAPAAAPASGMQVVRPLPPDEPIKMDAAVIAQERKTDTEFAVPLPRVQEETPKVVKEAPKVSEPVPKVVEDARELVEEPPKLVGELPAVQAVTAPDDKAVTQQLAQEEARAMAEQQAEVAAARQQAEERARLQAEALARQQAAALAQQQADQLARQQAEALARQQAEQLAQQQAEALAQQHAEALARQQAEALAKQQAEQLARQQAEALAQQQAQALAREQAEALARQQAEQLARQQAAALAQQQADALARQQSAQPGPGIGAGDGPLPRAMPASGVANRARELARGLDLLHGDPPVRPREELPRGRRVVSGASEHDVALRLYVDSFRQKVERNGTLNGGQLSSGRVRIDPLVSVALRSDGSVEDVIILRSSGRPETDDAVRRIVRLNARYSAFPPNVAARYDVVEIRRIWTFADGLKLIEELP